MLSWQLCGDDVFKKLASGVQVYGSLEDSNSQKVITDVRQFPIRGNRRVYLFLYLRVFRLIHSSCDLIDP